MTDKARARSNRSAPIPQDSPLALGTRLSLHLVHLFVQVLPEQDVVSPETSSASRQLSGFPQPKQCSLCVACMVCVGACVYVLVCKRARALEKSRRLLKRRSRFGKVPGRVLTYYTARRMAIKEQSRGRAAAPQ